MSAQLLDYHVGLMRGYMLANNAPTQILNALDVLLTGYHTQAGARIGQTEAMPPATKLANAIMEVSKTAPSHDSIEPDEPKKNKFFWSPADDEILEKMYCHEGARAKAIAKVIGRTPASVHARISNRGLKRAGDAS